MLHEHDASAVTVRTQMSRPRRLLGTGLLASRPYRLLRRVRTDLDEVRRHLIDGDPRPAVDVHEGHLPPRSQAPGIVDARDELQAEVCEVLATRADLETLPSWSERPQWRDDPRALGATMRGTDPDSPRYAILSGCLRRLGR